ncbi:MAG: YvcK family protein [Candidatus Spechtbacteria bacterium]|nr:YvcK family protein [Candidatus Spechtbacteria bacterium]
MAKKYKIKKVVVIGGGTGTSILLRGLKKLPVKLTAIITTADTGGSSGRLRKEIGMVPPGDARQCFVALNDHEHPILSHFNTRFEKGSLRGHTFGNLFLAILWQHHNDFQKAIEEAEKIFGAEHSIVPVTTYPTDIVARLQDGSMVKGEANIIKIERLNKKLKNIELTPKGIANPKAKKAIEEADFILVGPGNLFTSLTPPLLVKGIRASIKKSRAKKIYTANLMNQKRSTQGYFVGDYLEHFKHILGADIFDHVIYNTDAIDDKILKRFGVKDQLLVVQEGGADNRFTGAGLLDTSISKQDPNDPMKRTIIRHDPEKLADTIGKLLKL